MKNETPEQESEQLNYLVKRGEASRTQAVISQVIYTKHLGDLDQKLAFQDLKNAATKIKNGDLEYVEGALLNQAHTLDAIFNNLACKAANREWINHFEICMRLALKAQSQCRATLEALANIKNPTTISFVKQANIGHNQQINNGVSAQPASVSDPEKIKNTQNQLLEEHYGERLDNGTQSQTVKADKNLGTVEKFHRPEKPGG